MQDQQDLQDQCEPREQANLPEFFITHELSGDADERSLKRAYAKALKQIDQENDLAGFQGLRESYEHAQQWLRYRDWRQAQEQEQGHDQAAITPQAMGEPALEIQSPSTSKSESESPAVQDQAIAATMPAPKTADGLLELAPEEKIEDDFPDTIPAFFQAFENDTSTSVDVAKLDLLSDVPSEAASPSEAGTNKFSPELHENGLAPIDVAREVFAELMMKLETSANRKERSTTPAQDGLLECLADERLINVDTNDLFEWLIAHHLSQGWRSENADLFAAATRCFRWGEDRNRLLRFNDLGYFLNQALLEQSLFDTQETHVADQQLRIIRRGRDDEMPTVLYLKQNMPVVEQMVEHFPNWLTLVTKQGNLQQWRDFSIEQKLDIRPMSETMAKGLSNPDREKNRFGKSWILILGLMIFFRIIATMSPSSHPTPVALSQEKIDQLQSLTPLDENASPERLMMRGEDYYFGRNGISKDFNLAEQYWRWAAQKGFLEAQYNLARLYSDSTKPVYDMEQSHHWFLEAARNGKVPAYIAVAENFFHGRGTQVDYRQAYDWYDKSAKHGYPMAYNNLGVMYENGLGVKKDAVKSLAMFKEGAQLNDATAQANLGMIYLRSAASSAYAKEEGLKWLEKSARLENKVGMYQLGMIKEKALYGEARDFQQAATWYRKSFQRGNEEALKGLARVCVKLETEDCRPRSLWADAIQVRHVNKTPVGEYKAKAVP